MSIGKECFTIFQSPPIAKFVMTLDNMYERLNGKLFFTNNASEGLRNHLQSFVTAHYPSKK